METGKEQSNGIYIWRTWLPAAVSGALTGSSLVYAKAEQKVIEEPSTREVQNPESFKP